MITSDLTQIEKKTLIRAPRARVWRALTDPKQFGSWFGCEFSGTFMPGVRLDMISTGKSCPGQEFYMSIDRMEPEQMLSWTWSPGGRKPGEDRSHEGTTLVEFHLEDVDGGTLVTVVESGFDRISLARRARVFEENSKGWEHQINSLARYVTSAA